VVNIGAKKITFSWNILPILTLQQSYQIPTTITVQQFRHNSEMFQADGRQIEKLISRLAMWNSFVRPTFESGIDSYDIDCISSLSDHDPLLSQLDMTLSAHCAMLLQPRQHNHHKANTAQCYLMSRDGVNCHFILTIHSFNSRFCYFFFIAAVNKYIDLIWFYQS